MFIGQYEVDLTKGFTIVDRKGKVLKVYTQSYEKAKQFMREHDGSCLIWYAKKEAEAREANNKDE